MIAYKATKNFRCKEVTYEIGKIYTFEGEIELCERGFHFCKNPDDVFNYYDYNKDFVLLEIEVLGKTIDDDDKSVTDKFKVLREVPKSEYNNVFTRCRFDDNYNLIYYKNRFKYWEKFKYDENNNLLYQENSSGFWEKYEYNRNNQLIHRRKSSGFWEEYIYDENNSLIGCENSHNVNYKIKIEG